MKKNSMGLILIAYLAFVVLGLNDGLLGVAWPSLRETFGLPLDALGWLLLAGTLGYVTASFSNGRFIQRSGMAALLLISALMLMTGQLLQSTAVAWWIVVGATFVAGLGAGMRDAGLNTYAARRFRPRLINWLHASFGLGTTLGSLLMTAVLAAGYNWRLGVGLMALANVVVFVIFFLTRSRWRLSGAAGGEMVKTADVEPTNAQPTPDSRELLRLPIVWFSIILFFFYTGLEIGIGHWNFSLQTEARGIAATTAGVWTTLYWGSFTVGRVVLGFVEVNLVPLLRIALLGIIAGTFLLTFGHVAWLSLVGLLLLGFSLAPIFPGLVALTPERVGDELASYAIGYQIAAAGVGGALLPSVAGILADSSSLEIVPRFMLVVALLMFGLHEFIVRQRQQPAPMAHSTSV